jgi:hypothetical protein
MKRKRRRDTLVGIETAKETHSSMNSLEQRIATLEARLTQVEDQLALYQAVTTYGPAVDSLTNDVAGDLWFEDGSYDIGDPSFAMDSREEIIAVMNGAGHGALVNQGCAHVMSTPLVGIAGDRAIGLGYHRLYRHTGAGYECYRLSVSRWDWIRDGSSWRAHKRTHRLLDGSADARTLLRETLLEIRSMTNAV